MARPSSAHVSAERLTVQSRESFAHVAHNVFISPQLMQGPYKNCRNLCHGTTTIINAAHDHLDFFPFVNSTEPKGIRNFID